MTNKEWLSMTPAAARKHLGIESFGVYVATKRCGCWVGVVSNLLSDPTFTAREIAYFIKEGYVITFVTDEQWRDNKLTPSDKCPHGKAKDGPQMDLGEGIV